jgi:endoglucanase
MKPGIVLLGWLSLLGMLAATGQQPQPAAGDDARAHAALKRLGRGINLGNALEAPTEGAWGMKLEAEFFTKIRQAGFDSVRLPVRWSAHTDARPPYTIDPKFLDRVDWAIGEAVKNKLAIVVNVHHFDEMDRAPENSKDRLLGIWKQLAEHFRQQPEAVYFELLNEPHEKLTDDRWNAIFPGLLQTIRQSNPDRLVIIGPGNWNNLNNLDKLRLPETDRRLIATFHYYSPFEFTHQNAPWVNGSAKWKGRQWTGTEAEKKALSRDFQRVADWAKQHRRPIFLGEFGAFEAADMASRARWMAAVTREAEKHGFAWAYWEFGSGFGAYDRQARAWREPLLKALVPGR